MTTEIAHPPAKLSDLIRLAVSDGRKLDRKVFYPHSVTWFRMETGPEGGRDLCHVCLAGAVLAGTLQQPPRKDWEYLSDGPIVPWMKMDHWGFALRALDFVREGAYPEAVEEMPAGRHLDEKEKDELYRFVDMPQGGYFEGWGEFDKHLDSLLVIAGQLEELGY